MSWQNRIIGEGEEAPDQLLANPQNFRRHPQFQQESLQGALDEIGWIQRVIVNKRTGHMIDGHARVELALRQQAKAVPVLYVDLDEREEKIALATFDPISGLAYHDEQHLQDLLSEVTAESDELQAFFADLKAKNQPGPNKAPDENEDDAPDPPKKPKTKLGDIIKMGDHRLICGDSCDPDVWKALMGKTKADALITDPPYGVDYQEKNDYILKAQGRKANTKGIANDAGEVDYRAWFARWLSNAARHLASHNTAYITMSNREFPALSLGFEDAGFTRSLSMVWVKNAFVLGRQDYNHRHELILYGWFGRHKFYGAIPDTVIDEVRDRMDSMSKTELKEALATLCEQAPNTVVQADRPRSSKLHPTMKPISLMSRLITDGTPYGGVVMEPFCGSGSTLIACEKQGRKCRGIELSPEYCDVIVQRWEDYTGKKAERPK